MKSIVESKDPFAQFLREQFRYHFSTCAVAYVLLWVVRWITLRGLTSSQDYIIPITFVGVLTDFVFVVGLLTFARAFYSIPLYFVQPIIRRVGNYVIFGLVFAGIFSLRMEQCVGVQITENKVSFYFPFPQAALEENRTSLTEPFISKTALVTILKFPDTSYKLVPVYNFDSEGLAALHRLKETLSHRSAP
jgi:hypothetical protein